jgi:erythromycin esterase
VVTDDDVLGWIRSNADEIATTDPLASLDDLAPLEAIIGDAVVVAVGDSVRGARSSHEFFRLKHRVLRFAVERLGFRTLALEERDAGVGPVLDEHVRTGAGDVRTLIAQAWAPWRTRETVDALRWLRSYNAEHRDEMVRVISPVSDRPHGLAHHTLDWFDATGDKIVYWGGIAHTAVSHGSGDPNDGSVLRDRLGSGYRSIGLLAHHGTELPAAPEHFAEAMLNEAGPACYCLDLRGPHNEAVDQWLTGLVTIRLIGPEYEPANDAAYCMSGKSLAQWFDSIIFTQTINRARDLA